MTTLILDANNDDDTLWVRGGDTAFSTTYSRISAVEITGEYESILSGLEPPACSSVVHEFDALSARIWKDVLGNKAGAVVREFLHVEQDRIVRVVGASAFVNVPWEILKIDNDFVLQNPGKQIVRTIKQDGPESGNGRAFPDGPLRVLFIAANPKDLAPVEAETAERSLKDALWPWLAWEAVKIETTGLPTQADTLSRIIAANRDQPFDVVCFLAHGRNVPTPGMALAGPRGNAVWTTAGDLIPHLTVGNRPPRLLILGCCHLARTGTENRAERSRFNGFAEQALHGGVGAVISMQAEISTRGARAAMAAGIESLLRGNNWGQLAHDIRIRLRSEGRPGEWSLPVAWIHSRHDSMPQTPWRVHRPPKPELLSHVSATQGRVNPSPDDVEKAIAAVRLLDREIPSAHADNVKFIVQLVLDAEGRKLTEAASHGDYRRALAAYRRAEARTAFFPNHKLAEFARKIREPIASLIRRGSEHETRARWGEAAGEYRAACEAYATLSQDSPELQDFWSELDREASVRRRHASGRELIDAAEVARKNADSSSHIRDLREALRILVPLQAESCLFPLPKKIAEWTVELRAADLCESARAVLRCGGAGEVVARWEPLCTEPEFRDALLPAQRLFALVRQAARCEEALMAVKTARSGRDWGHARDVAGRLVGEGLTPLVQLVEADGLAVTLFPHADPARVPFSASVQDDCNAVRAAWTACAEDARQLQIRLARVVDIGRNLAHLGAETMPFSSDAEDAFLFQVPRVSSALLDQLREQLDPDRVEEFEDELPRRLGADFVRYRVAAGDWSGAHRFTAEQLRVAIGVPAAWRLAAASLVELAGMEPQHPDPNRVRNISVAAWSHLLTPDRLQALPQSGAPTIGEDEALAPEWTCFRARRSIARLLLQSGIGDDAFRDTTFRLADADAESTMWLALDAAALVLMSSPAESAAPYWRAAAENARHAGCLDSLAMTLELQVRDWVGSQRADSGEYWRDDGIELWETVREIVRGTGCENEAARQQAELRIDRGLERLRLAMQVAETCEVAYGDFNRANELCPTAASAALTALALAMWAECEVDPNERDRMRRTTSELMDQARNRFGNTPLLEFLGRFLHGSQSEAGAHFQMFEDHLRAARGGDGSSAAPATDAERAWPVIDEREHYG